MKLQIFDTPGDLFQAAAQEFTARAENSVKDHGRFCVALSGGSTPKGLFPIFHGTRFSYSGATSAMFRLTMSTAITA
jgi:6-phosphogluconolactonase/glucosamine-6-phosphate isomerase/deaminase